MGPRTRKKRPSSGPGGQHPDRTMSARGGAYSGIRLWIIALFLSGSLSAGEPANPQPKNVLIMMMDVSGRSFTDPFEASLRAQFHGDVAFYEAFLGESLPLTTPYLDSMARELRTRFAQTRLDLVVALHPQVLDFLVHYRDQAFPGVPIVYTEVSSRRYAGKRWPGMTGLTTTEPFSRTIDLALRLVPDTQNVAVIAGEPTDPTWLGAVQAELRQHSDRVKEIDILDPAGPDVLKRVDALPPRTIILFNTLVYRKGEAELKGYDLLEAVSERRPTFSGFPSLCLNHGCVGGAFEDIATMTERTAITAARVLSGESPDDIPPALLTEFQVQIDWQAFQRWKLDERRLPPGTILLNKPPTLWESYRRYVVFALSVILLQALLISGLMVNRARAEKANAALRRNRQRLTDLIDNTFDAIVVVDEERRIVLFNSAAERVFGLPAATAIGSPLERIIPERFRAEHSVHIRRFGETGTTNRVMGTLDTLWGLRATGEEFPIEVSISQVESSGKKLYTAIIRDTTERTRAAEALHESERRMSSLIAQCPVAILETDLENRVLRWNPAAAKIFGYSEAEVLGLDGRFMVPDNAKEHVNKVLEHLLAQTGGTQSTNENLTKSGKVIICKWYNRPVVDAEGRVISVVSVAEDVTEKIKLEQDLLMSEEKFRKAFFTGPDAFFLSTLEDGRLIEVNDICTALFGYSREELTGRSSSELGILDREDRRALLAAVTAGNTVRDVELDLRKKDGTLFTALLSISAVRMNNQALLLGVIKDITERKHAEAALRDTESLLRESEALFRSFFQLDLVGFSIVHPGKPGIIANERLCQMLGYSAEELSKLSWSDFTHPDDLTKSYAQFDQLIAGEIQSYSLEKRYLRKDGSILWARIAVGCVRNADGTVKQVGGYLEDISERMAAELAIRKAEKEYRDIFEQAVNGIVQVKPDGTLLAANPAFARILGYSSSSELLLASPNMAGCWRYPEKRNEFMREITEKGLVMGYEAEFVRCDGALIWVSVSERLVLGPNEEILYLEGFLEDITSRKHLEEQLIQTQKMDAIGRLAGGIAHDFNNILGIIAGYTDLNLEDKTLGERPRERAKEVKKAAERAIGITRQLLSFSRKEAPQTKILSLNDCVRDAASMLSRLLGEHIRVVTVLASDLGTIKADPIGIDQVLVNLAVNARDAMPDGGVLRVETVRVVLCEPEAEDQPKIPPGEYATLSVIDNGVGMDAPTRKRMFEPFFTTKEAGRGTGLGLATVLEVVKQCGAHISVHSEVGKGTRITIHFPLVEMPPSASEAPAGDNVEFGNGTVLLVEDDDGLRRLNAELVRELGYTVIETGSAAQALAAANGHSGPLHILITDVVMPEMNGYQLAARLQERLPEMKVLFVSGYTDVEVGNQIASSGADFLPKPFTKAALAAKLRGILTSQ